MHLLGHEMLQRADNSSLNGRSCGDVTVRGQEDANQTNEPSVDETLDHDPDAFCVASSVEKPERLEGNPQHGTHAGLGVRGFNRVQKTRLLIVGPTRIGA